MYLMSFSSVFMGYYILNIYKMLGATYGGYLSDDKYLTTVGMIASVTGCLRFTWAAALDF